MNGALRMHQHADLTGRHVEQAAGLDHFKAFVHQRRRVDGDALSHLPRRMVQRLLHRDMSELTLRSMQKRSARRGQPDTVHLAALPAPQTLMNSIVLAINW